MKKYLLSILLTVITGASFGQGYWRNNLDQYSATPQAQYDLLYVDKVANPTSKWQIGRPGKTVFNSPNTSPNVLVTDTLNSLPPNDTSIIYIMHSRVISFLSLHFKFKMDGDSADKGIIEVSPDSLNWINVLTEDTTYDFFWAQPKPTLMGPTTAWQFFDLDMSFWSISYPGSGGSVYPIYCFPQPIFPNTGYPDTVFFRFTYITSSKVVARDGWMIDDLYVQDFIEGIQEAQNGNLISIFPNPTADLLSIHSTTKSSGLSIQVFDFTGQLVLEDQNFKGQSLDTRPLENGVYMLKYSEGENYSLKKFVVQR